jgi:serine/threonine-protein kinase
VGEKVLVRAGGSPRQSPGANVETLAAPASSPSPAEGAEPAPLANGAIVAGKYLVEETLAEGGIGVVVVARHLALQQRVAIKYLKPKTLANPAIVERFVREARLAAQLRSEHVVRVFDVGTLPEAGPYMVMEYLVGEDLGRTVQAGPAPIQRTVDCILQACDALAEAHALRIVHRDIKPENMFLAQRASGAPVLKIIDFGISKVAPKRGEVEAVGTETASSERFGTPLYMSPEQLRATSSVDTRTDIWSLGIVFYELLTGSLPFGGADLPQICTSILTSAPPPMTALCPGLPPELEAAVGKCLEKDPARRFANVAELAQAIAPFGPASAGERVERIVELVRRADDSLRPPTPPGTPPPFRPLPAFTPPSVTTDARAVTTVNVRTPARRGRWAVLVGVGAAVGVGAILANTVRFGPATAAVMVAPAPPTSPAVSAPASLAAAIEKTAEPSPPPAAIVTAAAAPIASAHASASPTPRPPSAAHVEGASEAQGASPVAAELTAPRPKPARPRAATPSAAPKASPPATASGGSRRVQFGDRE